MWKVSVDYDEIVRYKQRNIKHDLEGDSENSQIFYPNKVQNSVFHG